MVTHHAQPIVSKVVADDGVVVEGMDLRLGVGVGEGVGKDVVTRGVDGIGGSGVGDCIVGIRVGVRRFGRV